MFKELKQLKYPKQFRIGNVPLPEDIKYILDNLDELTASQSNSNSLSRKVFEQEPLLKDIATGLWRIRQKVNPLANGSSDSQNRPLIRSIDSTWDALIQSGVEIKDHTGDIITGGEALNIIAFQETKSLVREEVIETIKPTIYFKERLIQKGEVIVGTPEK